jgi:hypothetical protein
MVNIVGQVNLEEFLSLPEKYATRKFIYGKAIPNLKRQN